MQDQEKAVEAKTETNAATPHTGVETTASTTAPVDDPEAKLSALLAENERLRQEKDNYKRVALSAKDKIDAEGLDLSDPVQLKAYIDRVTDERLLATREAQSAKELIEFAKDLARKNKELATSVANRSQLVNASTGSGASSTETKSNSYWSPDQSETLRKRWKAQGIPDERVEKMLVKAEENARRAQ